MVIRPNPGKGLGFSMKGCFCSLWLNIHCVHRGFCHSYSTQGKKNMGCFAEHKPHESENFK